MKIHKTNIFLGNAGRGRYPPGQVLWDRGGLQCDGHGVAWPKLGGLVQFLQ